MRPAKNLKPGDMLKNGNTTWPIDENGNGALAWENALVIAVERVDARRWDKVTLLTDEPRLRTYTGSLLKECCMCYTGR